MLKRFFISVFVWFLPFATVFPVKIYTIGDSTMADKQNPESNKERGWGMVFQQFFVEESVTVENHARNGRSAKSFINEGRWSPIVNLLQPGDYVFIQFGHNDEKEDKASLYTNPAPSCTDPELSYRAYLKKYVEETRAKGAIPVLLTSVVRRHFDEKGVLLNSHGEYPDAVREVAKELDVALIDMEAKSRRLVQDLGDKESARLFMISTGKDDNTHFVEAGALAMARLAAKGICENGLPLCQFLKKEMIEEATDLTAQRTVFSLEKNWKFTNEDIAEAKETGYQDDAWQSVTIPHDWAIYGPFDRKYDLQNVTITQNGEKVPSVKTGRTGGLPYIGVGWYRTTFDIENFDREAQRINLLFDGAMSEAHIFVNGQEVCFWPYGYNAFHCDVTDVLNRDGKGNLLAVRLENRPQSSRWYPGAGLYRNVHVIRTNKLHVPIWGSYVTTPFVSQEYASVRLETKISESGKTIRMMTEILDADGRVVALKDNTQQLNNDRPFVQNFTIDRPRLWSPESPSLYRAVSKIYLDGQLVDEYTTRFGIREIRFVADKGFFLNGERRKFQGVCNHHDLGPLGAAINEAALRRQLTLLKDMGCDAIRTSHNMPAPELVRLCDEMGFMMVVENFDEWDRAKCKNGYHRFFGEWAEKDMVNMLHHFRNNPSVIMWSIGNEVPTQCSNEGYKVAAYLQDICHREDPTRPVTCGMDQVSCVLSNGFAAMIDIPGFNYRTHRYEEAYRKLPQNLVLGSETSSTVSSRGVYKFPVEKRGNALYDDHQSSSYDLEHCSWSNIPDEDFALADDFGWTLGQFVWTGFDYLGEPSPYDTDSWPNHSSLFGIIDLASIPKDRYYLYRSIWNRTAPTLHILPHWNWEGRIGETTPVFVYTSYPSAELFVNGKSYGKRSKNSNSLTERYRLMWMDVAYEPGEIKVVAYDAQGNVAEEKRVGTAGKPQRIELIPDRKVIRADGKDLVYVNVRVVDKEGNLCPHDDRLVNFNVKGSGVYRASANGDPTSLDPFHLPRMHLFNGQLTMIVQAKETAGDIRIEATANGLKRGIVVVESSMEN